MKRRALLLTLPALAVQILPGRAVVQRLDLHGCRTTLEIKGEADAELAAMIPHWVIRSAQAVHTYYGMFPVDELYIHVPVGRGKGVRGGQTFPGDVPLIRVRAGRASTESDLMQADWVMVHEMIHLAFPWMDGEHNWMAEGLAVYVESIARVQAGHLEAPRVWRELHGQMARGLPGPGAGGLDQTDSWAGTYWGGALFCFLADIRIRSETDNRFGLQHALRAIVKERNFKRRWPFRETLELGDAATGRTVLASLYDDMRATPVSPDLDRIWRELGVVPASDAAPMAATRRAIMARI